MGKPLFSRALRGSVAALFVDGAGHTVYLALAFAGTEARPSSEAVTPLALAIDSLFWCTVGFVVLGAPVAAAFAARSGVPRERRRPWWRTALASSAALPLALCAVPPIFLGHIIVDGAFYVAYYVALALVRALAHGGLAGLGAEV